MDISVETRCQSAFIHGTRLGVAAPLDRTRTSRDDGYRATPMPVRCTRRRFEELVSEAIDMIPDELADAMDNVAVVVEDWPSPDQLVDAEHGTLLGLYQGVSLTERGPLSYSLAAPDRISVFRGPLCQLATDEDDLAEQIAVTVVHEIAHHFGIDDERLDELGWA